MIILINGAFGVGKTSVANCLAKNIENSMIYDPEEVGILLRNIIPTKIKWEEAKTGDFQDLILWKRMVIILASEIKQQYNKHLIVPMTIRNVEYFKYIFDGMKKIDNDIYHFCLTAPLDKIHSRLEQRGEIPNSWAFLQTEKCLKAYEEHDFSEYVDTQNISIEEVTQIILNKIHN